MTDILLITARLHDPLLMRSHTPDPKYTEYGDASAWNHCLANPVNLIDPVGEDTYKIDQNGRIINVTKDDNADIIQIVNDSEPDKILNTHTMDYGTIKGVYKVTIIKTNVKYLRFNIGNSTAGKKLYEFLSDNTKVEWGNIITKNGLSYITTTNETQSEAGSFMEFRLRFKSEDIIEQIHSHPSPIPSYKPSGMNVTDVNGDIPCAKMMYGLIHKYNKHSENKKNMPILKIYVVPLKGYQTYTHKTNNKNFRKNIQ